MRLGMGLGLGNLLSGNSLIAFPNEYSFNFDGSNDYLEAGESSALGTGTNFSVSFWFKSEATSKAYLAQIQKGAGSSGLAFLANSVGTGASAGNITALVWNGSTHAHLSFDGSIDDGEWHHLAFTTTSSAQVLYFDGQSVDTDTIAFTNAFDSNPIVIGARGGPAEFFDGLIDEFAIWDTVLDANTIAKLGSKPLDLTKHSASNLKLWLRCGDKAEPESTTSIARSDFSAELDGSNDYVDLGSATFLTHSNSFTISAWVKKTGQPSSNVDTNDNPTIISQGNVYFTIFVNYDGMLGVFFYNSSNATIYTIKSADGAISLNTWHHVALAWNSTSSQLYVDGVSVYSGSVTPYNLNTGVNGTEPRIGSHASGGQSYWNGVLSSLSVHKTNLPANDIAIMSKSRFRPTRDYMLKQVDFDGSNDYLNCGASNSIISGTNITLSCWFKSADTDDSKLMQLKRTSTGSNLSLDVNVGGSAGHVGAVLRHSGGANTTISADGSVDDGAWHHLAISTTSSAQVLYLDGVELTTGSVAFVDLFSTDPFTIGGQDGSSYSFGGSIAGVAVYSDAKDADFIYAQYAKGLFADWSADTNLSGYWKMGNGTGDTYPTIVDQSSNSNNGTMTSMASDDIVENMVAGYDLGSYNTSSVATTVSYLDFNGSSDFVQLPMAFSQSVFSISIWYNAQAQDDYFFDARDSNSSGIVIGTLATGKLWIAIRGTTSNSLITTTGSFNEWNHVVVTYDGSTAKIYINGADVSPVNNSFSCTISTTTNARIGAFSYQAGGYFDGGVASVGLYTTAKTQAEAQAIYDEGIAGDESTNSGIFVFYKLDTASTSSGAIKDLVGTNHGTVNGTPSLGSYYKNGNYLISPVEDTKNGVIDVSNPTLGVDIIGTWVNNGYNTLTVSTSTISSGVSDGSGNDLATSPFTAVSDKLYKLNINLTLNSGTAPSVFIADDTSGTTSTGSTSQVLTSGENNIYWFGDSGATRYVTIKNASTATNFSLTSSIKQVQGNVGKPTSMDATNFPYTSVLPDQSFLTGVNSAYNYLDFDGTDAYVDIPSPLSYTNHSISVWVYKPDSGANTIFDARDSGGDGIRLIFNTNESVNYRVDSSSLTSPSNGYVDDWFHVVVTYDGTTQKMYIDNSLVNSQSATQTIATTTNARLGNRNYSTDSGLLNGNLSQFAFWSKALEASDVSSIYNAGRHSNLLDSYSDNLEVYYAFGALDAITGLADTDSTIYDRSGNGLHGTTSGTASGDLKSPPNAEPEGYDIESTTRTTTIP